MTELWLRFKNGNGEEQRVPVEGEKFTVGRHSDSDLPIANGKLSREHIKIDRFADIFVVSDCGSSNGTKINGQELKDPVALKNGDCLDLGGGIEIQAELISDDPNAAQQQPSDAGGEADSGDSEPGQAPNGTAAGGASAGSSGTTSASGGSGIPTSVFIIAPVLGVVILVILGGAIYFLGSGPAKPTNDNEFVYTNDPPVNRDRPSNKGGVDPPSNTTKTGNTIDSPPANSAPNSNGDIGSTPPPDNQSDAAKCERNGASFLRRMAVNEPNAFLTGEQAQIVSGVIKQIGNSSAVAENINSARRNSTQLSTLAASKGLKPQLLATAALTKLGTSRGDVLKTAQEMSGILDKLGQILSGELANESLLTIAAYDQGEAGDFMKMRNMLQDLAGKTTESPRTMRTIWFLHKNGKITDSEYNFALRFLAIGTITQNPKDFGVNAEALTL